MHLKKLDRSSRLGRIYFWYWNHVPGTGLYPEREDTCGVRKVLILAFAAFLIFGRHPRESVFRPWYILAVAVFAWLCKMVPQEMAIILLGLVAFIVLFVAVVAVLEGIAAVSRGFRDWLDDLLGRLFDRLGELLEPAFRPVSKAWKWFWTKEPASGWPLYPWVVTVLIVQAASGIAGLIATGQGWAIPFRIILAIEGIVAFLVIVMMVKEWAEEHEVGERIGDAVSGPFQATGAIGKPIAGSGRILSELWKSLKNRVCTPVEWGEA